MTWTGIAAVALGSGCIFDQGTYEGGGRRTGSPQSSQADTSTPPTSTGTGAGTASADSGGNRPPQDADPFDQ